MKNKLFVLVTLILTIGLLASCQTTEAPGTTPDSTVPAVEETTTNIPKEVSEGFGSAGALANDDASIEQMLIYAIQDEYAARAEYEYLIEELGAGAPFTNIIKAEVTHIEMLVPLFSAYELEVPEDTSSEHLLPAKTITEALETGVIAEINNIDMYNLFLEQDLPDDIIEVFTSLRDASENHLQAFQRKLDRN